MLDSKLHFHRHVDYLHSQALKLLGLIRFITYNFSSLDSLSSTCLSSGITLLKQILISWETYEESLPIYATIDLFSPILFVIMNQCWIIYILKYFIPSDKILMLYLLLMFSRTKLIVGLLWILLVSVYPLSKLGTFPPLTSVMSQDLTLQQGASQLQRVICCSLDVFNKHTISLENTFSSG
jgi:hypothetical protein